MDITPQQPGAEDRYEAELREHHKGARHLDSNLKDLADYLLGNLPEATRHLLTAIPQQSEAWRQEALKKYGYDLERNAWLRRPEKSIKSVEDAQGARRPSQSPRNVPHCDEPMGVVRAERLARRAATGSGVRVRTNSVSTAPRPRGKGHRGNRSGDTRLLARIGPQRVPNNARGDAHESAQEPSLARSHRRVASRRRKQILPATEGTAGGSPYSLSCARDRLG